MKLKLILLIFLNLIINTSIFSQVSAPSIETAFQNYLRAESGRVYTGSSLPVFLIKENTKGTRYLFDKWVKGSVTSVDGVLYNASNVSFNYDKISKKLYMFINGNTVIELDSGDIAGFSLKENDSEYNFERLKNSIDLNFYVPVYKNEKGYSLYKLLTTKFKKADYQTNGIIESGNKYDEYVDEEEYYILSPKKEMTKIIFKEKYIKKALYGESSKIEAFFSGHKKEKINEEFLKHLIQYLNTEK